MSSTPTLPSISEQRSLDRQGHPFVQLRLRRPPFWKRAIDIVGALFLALMLSPLLVAIAIYVKVVSKGPVIFRQQRIGIGAKHFVIWKFRTMEVSTNDQEHRTYIAGLALEDVPARKPDHSGRMIPGGEILRSLSLDELPQLFNVLVGNMSLVGPRPEVLEIEDYELYQLRRFEVLPGISGLWQVSGKNRLTFRQMIELDLQYIDRFSLMLDVKIMLRTFRVIFTRDNE